MTLYHQTKVYHVAIISNDSGLLDLFKELLRRKEKFVLLKPIGQITSAVHHVGIENIDILVIDLLHVHPDTYESIVELRRANPELEVIVFSSLTQKKIVLDIIRSGVIGYVLKDQGPAGIVDALETISLGGAPLSHSVARTVVESLHLNPDTVLTKRETQILAASYKGQTYVQIARQLKISGNTVRVHLRNIYVKLSARTKADAIRVALENNFI
jgi:DNA-binding NarL/FixJ family response regulator